MITTCVLYECGGNRASPYLNSGAATIWVGVEVRRLTVCSRIAGRNHVSAEINCEKIPPDRPFSSFTQ
jgi:hypothetical protein